MKVMRRILANLRKAGDMDVTQAFCLFRYAVILPAMQQAQACWTYQEERLSYANASEANQ